MCSPIRRRSLIAGALALTLPGVSRAQSPCCGPVSPAGLALARALDGMDVEKHWLGGSDVHIDWRSGDPDGGAYERYDSAHTHCSAFAAAAADRLGVYLLRPPEHGQTFLANAQGERLAGAKGAAGGWRPVSMHEAQEQANRGNLVVAIFVNPLSNKPGHAAIVRPSEKSEEMLQGHGPEIIMAGSINARSTTTRWGFRTHPGAFPNSLRYYVHALSL